MVAVRIATGSQQYVVLFNDVLTGLGDAFFCIVICGGYLLYLLFVVSFSCGTHRVFIRLRA